MVFPSPTGRRWPEGPDEGSGGVQRRRSSRMPARRATGPSPASRFVQATRNGNVRKYRARPPLPARPASRAGRHDADLDHAPGRPLSARISRDARARRQFPRARQDAGARLRSHVAAARAFRARCGDPVLGHPDDSRCDGSWPALRRRRRPEARASAAQRGRHRAARRARCRTRSRLRDGCGAPDPPRARRSRAADRFRRKPVDARLLHDRRRRLGELSRARRRSRGTIRS